MRTEPFLSICIRNKVSILIPGDKRLEEYKKATKTFNYPCEFDRMGKCIAIISSSDCGCEDCAHKFGYIKHIRAAQHTINKYAALFNQTTGFWRSNKGCILPHNLRSIRCLTRICSTKFESMNSKKVVEFIGILSKYTTLSIEEKERLHKLYLKI